MIKHKNIIFVGNIAAIGGVETYLYELVKKYHDYDIGVVYRFCDPIQKKRLKQFVPVYELKNEPIECEVAVINCDMTILDYLPKEIYKENLKPGDPRGIYQGVHADYTHPAMGKLPQDPRIKEYLCITKEQMDKFPLMTSATNYRLCRNPLTLEPSEKPLVIVSPTRLTKQKGGEMMLRLSYELERQGTKYVWFVITTEEYLEDPIFKNRNVIWIKSRLDIDYFLSLADWVVLPSECEGDSYTIREALYRGIPIVARELGYFKEYGIKDGKNALFINDLNIEKVAKRMLNRLKFTFEPIKDSYDEIFIKSKSHYKPNESKVKLKCICWTGFSLNLENRFIQEGETIEVSEDRAEDLLHYPNCFEVVDEKNN